jgi:hypothetical protein
MKEFDIEVLRMVATLVAAFVAMRQYLRAQAWKRMEFVAREVERFHASPAVARVLIMLKWEGGTIDLGWRDAASQSATVTTDLVIRALRLPNEICSKRTELEALVRHQFEQFIEFLEHFETVIEAGLVKPVDLCPYIEKLASDLSGNGDVQRVLLEAFWTFVDSYGHEKARRLVNRFHPTLSETLPETPSLRAVVGRIGCTIFELPEQHGPGCHFSTDGSERVHRLEMGTNSTDRSA